MLKNKNSGFTLAEIILTIAIISILTVISFGDIVSILGLSKSKQEEVTMQEIKKAMNAFMADNKQLPDEDGNTLGLFPASTSWAGDLVGYTNLSENDMLNDTWFGLRQYKVFSNTEVFRQVSFETYYGVVYSYGEDGVIDAVGDSILANITGDETISPGAGSGAPLLAFGGVDDIGIYNVIENDPDFGDDQFFKLSDRQEKMDSYEITIERLAGVSSALQVYGQSMLNFAISANEIGWRSKIFFPPSVPQAAGGQVADNALYGSELVQVAPPLNGEMQTFIGRATIRTDGAAVTDAIRRTDMIGMMRMLGLPDEYCCSAMKLGGDNLPNPFYYFSNPRRKLNGAPQCAPRGSDPEVDVVLPPRITIEIETDTCG